MAVVERIGVEQTSGSRARQAGELLWVLTVAQLKARYRRSFLGFFWSLITPLFQIVIVGFVIQQLLQHEIDNFTVKYLCGLLPWLFFNDTILGACPTYLQYRQVVKKIYFARWALPVSIATSSLAHFLVSLAILFCVFLVIPVQFDVTFLFLIVLILIQMVMVTGLALLFSVMHTFYQDVEYALGSLIRVLMFVTPVFYPTAEIPESYRYLFLFNPMATICEGFRGVLLRNELPQIEHLLSTTIFSLLCLAVGWYYYARHQHELPEVL